MKEIKLTQGKVALVDDEDFEYLNQWKWYAAKRGNSFYASRKGYLGYYKYISINMHSTILPTPKGLCIDHINQNGLDNRKVNLRIVTKRENLTNLRKQNKTGFVGVNKDYHKYRAKIRINGRRISLGNYNSAIDAHNAYLRAFNEINSIELNRVLEPKTE